MTQKLKIIGSYTPEHPGPFVLDLPVRKGENHFNVTIHCVVDDIAFISTEDMDKPWTVPVGGLLCAEEVPVAREFWVNEYKQGRFHSLHRYIDDANHYSKDEDFIRTIHVREVLPE